MSANCNWTKTEEGDAYDTDCGHSVSKEAVDMLDPVQFCPFCGLEMDDGSDMEDEEDLEDDFSDEDEEELYDDIDD